MSESKSETNSDIGLERFIEKQEEDYEDALKEIKNGKKESCWMWYIFPQLKGLGKSNTAEFYGIKDIEEAIQYLSNEKLKKNLIDISQALLDLGKVDITEVMGYIDDIKLQSSMTLFNEAEKISNINCEKIFKKVLEQFFDDVEDKNTLDILEKQKKEKEENKEEKSNEKENKDNILSEKNDNKEKDLKEEKNKDENNNKHKEKEKEKSNEKNIEINKDENELELDKNYE